MVYVKHFDILGVDTAQIPCIELNGVPNAATVGAVGLLGMDMTSEGHEIYVCTAVNGSVYTWQCIKSGKDGTCVNKAEIINDELILTLSNGVEINAGVVRGATGKAGKDGKDGSNGVDGKDGLDGKDGISVVKADFNESLELVLTLSDGTTITAGKVIPELKDFMGTIPIGSSTQPIYYDGEKFTDARLVPREITLENSEWEFIDRVSQAGLAREYFHIGERKKVTLVDGTEVYFVIVGFDHDNNEDKTKKLGITFGLERPYKAIQFPSDVLSNAEFGNLPSDLQSVIKVTSKNTVKSVAAGTTLECYQVKTFSFGTTEVVNKKIANFTDGEQYEFWKNGGSLIKIDGSGRNTSWWLRVEGGAIRPYIDSTGTFVEGGTNVSSMHLIYGFCI